MIFEQKKYVELTHLNFVTFTVNLKLYIWMFQLSKGKGHKIRLQGRLISKVTWWDSIGENAYSLWKHIMQNSTNPGLFKQALPKVEKQLLSAVRCFTLNKVFVASLSTYRPSFSHRYIVSFVLKFSTSILNEVYFEINHLCCEKINRQVMPDRLSEKLQGLSSLNEWTLTDFAMIFES